MIFYGQPRTRIIHEPSQGEFFDIAAADRERLDARLGGQPWTERAAGRDELLSREVSDKIKQSLGEHATEDEKPE